MNKKVALKLWDEACKISNFSKSEKNSIERKFTKVKIVDGKYKTVDIIRRTLFWRKGSTKNIYKLLKKIWNSLPENERNIELFDASKLLKDEDDKK